MRAGPKHGLLKAPNGENQPSSPWLHLTSVFPGIWGICTLICSRPLCSWCSSHLAALWCMSSLIAGRMVRCCLFVMARSRAICSSRAPASSNGPMEEAENALWSQAMPSVDNVETRRGTFPVGTGVEHDRQHHRPAHLRISGSSIARLAEYRHYRGVLSHLFSAVVRNSLPALPASERFKCTLLHHPPSSFVLSRRLSPSQNLCWCFWSLHSCHIRLSYTLSFTSAPSSPSCHLRTPWRSRGAR